LPSVDGGARVCWEGAVPLWLVFLGAVGEEATVALLNNSSRPLVPVAFSSGVNGAVSEACTGVCAFDRSVSDRQQCWWRASSRLQRWLWVLQTAGVQIELDSPSALVDGELRFKI
jgi:hypothetical protein